MSKIEIEDDNIDNLRTFYSCLYRSMLFPRSFYEIDAKGESCITAPITVKCVPAICLPTPVLGHVPLSVSFPQPDVSVNESKDAGRFGKRLQRERFLPEWASPGHRDCMVGNNSASVVADAYIKGLRGYDIETLWEALKHGANAHLRGTASGRLGYESYNQLGYVANNIGIGQKRCTYTGVCI